MTTQKTINEAYSHTGNTDVDLVLERSQTDQQPKGDGSCSSSSTARVTPAQDRVRKEIAEINEELASYSCIREKAGLSVEYNKRVESLEKKKAKCEKDLKRKVIEQRSQQKVRNKKSKVLEKLKQDHPEAAESISKLQVRYGIRGRPPVEDEMPGLHLEILSVVIPESATEEKRRSMVYDTVRSLDDLVAELDKRGHHLKRTAPYYRYALLHMLFFRNCFIRII